jgi:hypothetical protein
MDVFGKQQQRGVGREGFEGVAAAHQMIQQQPVSALPSQSDAPPPPSVWRAIANPISKRSMCSYRKRSTKLVFAALAFTVSLALRDAFNETFEAITRRYPKVKHAGKWAYAVLLLIIALYVGAIVDRLEVQQKDACDFEKKQNG